MNSLSNRKLIGKENSPGYYGHRWWRCEVSFSSGLKRILWSVLQKNVPDHSSEADFRNHFLINLLMHATDRRPVYV
jgi:hypothetical protein